MASPDEHEILVRAEGVSKKFCRSLKRSLWYGVNDIASALNPFSPGSRQTLSAPSSTPNSELPPLRKDEFWAVQNVSFALRRGECLGLIGHNGAGKSTLLKILNGLIPPDAGSITMKGRVAALIELNAGFNPILSGRENIFNQASLLGFTREETLAKFDKITEFAEIGDFLDMPVQNYSSGMRVRLGFAIAAQMEPDVLIIDEVLAVGDVAFRFKCLNAIGELMKKAAVIFVTHTMPQVFRICSDVMVLDHGRVTYRGCDIAKGVDLYLGLLEGTQQTVMGSGEARLLDIRLSGKGGETFAQQGETFNVSHGESFTIEAGLKLDIGIREARVEFLLWNAEMLPVSEIMTENLCGFLLQVPESGIVRVSVTLPRIELGGGKYSLSIIIVSPDHSRVMCRLDNAAFLQVTANSPSGAYWIPVAKWSTLESAPQNAVN